MVVPNPVYREVIFLIDGSASLSGVMPSLVTEYLQPCIEHFMGNKLVDSPFDPQCGPVQYSLVIVNPPAAVYRPVCTYYPVTFSPTKVLKWIQDLRLEGGLVGNSLLLSEGFAAVMEISLLMDSTRDPCLSPDLTIEKHCVMVVNLPPSAHPCVESLRYAGKTFPQMMKLMSENQIQLSVVSPCSLPSFKDIIGKMLSSNEADTSVLDEADHSLHPGHLVLFNNFQITSIKLKREKMEASETAIEEKMEVSEQSSGIGTSSAANIAMETSGPGSVGVTIKEEVGKSPSQPQINSLTTSATVKLEPNRSLSFLPSSGVTLSGGIKQEAASDTGEAFPGNSTASNTIPSLPSAMETLSASLSAEGKMVMAGPADGQAMQAPVSAGNSSHNPIQITSPIGLQNISDKSFSMTASTLGTIMSTAGASSSKVVVSSLSQQVQLPGASLGQQLLSLPNTISSSGSTYSQAVVSMPVMKSEQAPPSYTNNTAIPANQQQAGGVAQANTFIKDKPLIASSQSNAPLNRTTSSVATVTVAPLGTGQKANYEKAMLAAQLAVMMAQASGQSTSSSAGVGTSVPQRTGPLVSSNPTTPGVKVPVMSNTGNKPDIKPGQPASGIGLPQNQQVPQPVSIGNKTVPSNAPQTGVQPYRVPTPPVASSAAMAAQTTLPAMPTMTGPPSTQALSGQGTYAGQQPTVQQPTGQQPTVQQPPQQQQQRSLMMWNGIMELAELQDNQRQVRQVRCSVSTTRSENFQELLPQSWPAKMTMNAYPKGLFNSIMHQMDFNRVTASLKTVNFHFHDNLQSISMLRQLMLNEIKSFAIVHLVGGNMACPVKALILVWNEKQKQFTGLVPLEQDKFVVVIKQVLIARQRQWKDQKQLQQIQPQKLVSNTGSFQQQSNSQQQLAIQNQQQVMNITQQQQQQQQQQINQSGLTQPSNLQQTQIPPPTSLSAMVSQPQNSGMMPLQQQAQQSSNLMGPGVGMAMQQHNQMPHLGFPPGQGAMQQQQQQVEKQAQLEKIFMFLLNSKPDQHELLFQRIKATTPEQKQQWLNKANLYKQQQQVSQGNRMMGGGQQASLVGGAPMQQQQPGMQVQRTAGRGMPLVASQAGLPYSHPQNQGLLPQQQQQQQQQNVPGMRPPNMMPPQQQLPPGYNQWQP